MPSQCFTVRIVGIRGLSIRHETQVGYREVYCKARLLGTATPTGHVETQRFCVFPGSTCDEFNDSTAESSYSPRCSSTVEETAGVLQLGGQLHHVKFGMNKDYIWPRVVRGSLLGSEVLNIRLKVSQSSNNSDRVTAADIDGASTSSKDKSRSRRWNHRNLFKSLSLTKAIPDIGEVSIRAKEAATLGSRSNLAWYPIHIPGVQEPVGEIFIAVYWSNPDHRAYNAAPSPIEAGFNTPLTPTASSSPVFQHANSEPLGTNVVPQRASELSPAQLLRSKFGIAAGTQSSQNQRRRYSHALSPADESVQKAISWQDRDDSTFWRMGRVSTTSLTKLKVAVLKADGLRSADANNSSDPYCTVSCCGKEFSTRVIKRTLQPEWNERFDFSQVDRYDEEDQITVMVFDWDFATKNDELGMLILPLWKILLDNQAQVERLRRESKSTSARNEFKVRTWYHLHPTHMQEMKQVSFVPESLGRIQLEVTFSLAPLDATDSLFVPATLEPDQVQPQEPPALIPIVTPKRTTAQSSYSSADELDHWDVETRSGEGDNDDPLVSNTRRLNRSKSDFAAHRDVESKPHKPMLRVRVVQARNLTPSDANGKSDPYCIVRCLSSERRTPTIKRTLDPKWNCTFEFGESDYITESDVLQFVVKDKDFGYKDLADDDIGYLELPIWSAIHDGECTSEPAWYALESKNSLSAGEVQIMVRFQDTRVSTTQSGADIYKGKVWLYELQVTLLSAKNLVVGNPRTRSSDPYVVLKCGAEERRSRTIHSSTNPVWNQRFKFKQPKGMTRPGLGRKDTLTLAIYDHDKSGADCPLGKVDVPLSTLIDRLGYIDAQGKEMVDYFPVSYVDGIPLSLITTMDSALRSVTVKKLRSKLSNFASAFRRNSGQQSKSNKTLESASIVPNTEHEPDSTPWSGGGVTGMAALSAFTAGTARHMKSVSDGGTKLLRSSTLDSQDIHIISNKLQLNDGLDVGNNKPFGEVQLRLRLVPIGETRMMKRYKLVARVYRANNLGMPGATQVLPRYVYVKVKVGLEVKESCVFPLYPLHPTDRGSITVNSLFIFDNEIDWIVEQIEQGTAGPESQLASIAICDAQTDRVLVSMKDTLCNVLEWMNTQAQTPETDVTVLDQKNPRKVKFQRQNLSLPQKRTWFEAVCNRQGLLGNLVQQSSNNTPTNAKNKIIDRMKSTRLLNWKSQATHLKQVAKTTTRNLIPITDLEQKIEDHPHASAVPSIQARFRLMQVEEELVPTLGLMHITVFGFKSFTHGYKQTLRIVVNHGDRAIPMNAVVNNPHPKFTKDNRWLFSVKNMYTPLVIQLWESKKRKVALNDAGALGATKDDGVAGGSTIRHAKLGKLVACTTLSPYDLLEFEAQLLFRESSFVVDQEYPPIKLDLFAPNEETGKERVKKGTIWIEARYVENFTSGVLTPNPNPFLRKEKPFSIQNFRHELERTRAVLQWVQDFGNHVSELLNWTNPTKTVFVIVFVALFCLTDRYAAHPLAVPALALLLHLVNRHRMRVDGRFSELFQDRQDETDVTAKIRIGVIQARNLVPMDSHSGLADPHARVSLRDATHAIQSTNYGCTRTVPSCLTPHFATTKLGYGTKRTRVARNRVVRTSKAKHTTPPPKIEVIQWELNLDKGGIGAQPIPGFEARLYNRPPKTRLLNVCIRAARGISGNCDPFVKGKIVHKGDASSGESKRTATKKKTKFPVWDKMLLFGTKGTLGMEDSLQLTIVDEDLGPDHKIAQLVIRLADIYKVFSAPEVEQRDLRSDSGETFMNQSEDYLNLQATRQQALGTGNSIQQQSPTLFDGHIGLFNSGEYNPIQQPVQRWLQMSRISGTHSEPVEILMSAWWVDYSLTQPGPPDGLGYAESVGDDSDVGTIGTLSSFDEESQDEDVDDGKEPFQKVTNSFSVPSNDSTKSDSDSEVESNIGSSDIVVAADSWKRNLMQVLVDIYDQDETHQQFMGRAIIPVAHLVSNEDDRRQTVFEKWVPLAKCFDGKRGDRDLTLAAAAAGKVSLGEVLVRAELTLPDPAAKELAMEREEAKRADRSGPLAKFAMINRKMAQFQNSLYRFNNQAERFKNLFNWSHPKKTQLILRLVTVQTFLFLIVPSRYIVLFVTLFLFTEHFRPMGTMKLKFMHLMSLAPTDDDIRDVCQGPVVCAKTKVLNDQTPVPPKRTSRRSTSEKYSPSLGTMAEEELVQNSEIRRVPSSDSHEIREGRGSISRVNRTLGRTSALVIEKLSRRSGIHLSRGEAVPSDAAISGHLRVYMASRLLMNSKEKWHRRYYILSPVGLHWWNNREHSEEQAPAGHITDIKSCQPVSKYTWQDLQSGCPDHRLMFQVTYEKDRDVPGMGNPKTLTTVYFACTNESKRDKWVECVLEQCFNELTGSSTSPVPNNMF